MKKLAWCYLAILAIAAVYGMYLLYIYQRENFYFALLGLIITISFTAFTLALNEVIK